MRAFLAAAFAFVTAGLAHADPARDAASLIASSHADGVFTPLNATSVVSVRHAQSGLVCAMPPANTNRLILFPGAPRGDDVACDSTDGAATTTLYATRYPVPTTADEQLQRESTDLHHRFADARLFVPAQTDPADATSPTSVTSRFHLTLDTGAHAYSRISVAQISGWTLMLQYTAIAADDASVAAADHTAALIWANTVTQFAH